MSNWERGIVVGMGTSGSIRYVASSYDTLALFTDIPMVDKLKVGNCIEFRAVIIPGNTNTFGNRKIVEFRQCHQFVEWEAQRGKNSALLEVYDSNLECPRTYQYSDEELLNMKVVAMRYVNGSTRIAHWGVLNIQHGNHNNNHIKKGFIFSSGTTKLGKDELYVWIPGRPRDVMLPVHLRKNISRERFYGRWVSFSMSSSTGFMDDDNDVRIIDDLLPTRYRFDRWEVRVPVDFNTQNRNERNIELNSDLCGIVVDFDDVLQKYNRLYSFSDQAWVHNYFYDTSRNIRFILSDKQEEWERPQREPFNTNLEEYSENRKTVSLKKNDLDSGVFEHQRNLKDIQEKLKELRMEHDFFMENGGGVPRKLLEDLKSTEAEEERMRNSRQKDNDKVEMDDDWLSRKEMAKREVKQEEFMNYKNLVVLFRGMLSSNRVSEEMNRYDPSLLHKINQRIRDL